MKILITGGAGYIGSVATVFLQEQGHEIIVLDNLSHGNRDAVPADVRFVEGDIADVGTLLSRADGIEAVIHLAAFIAAGESMKEPRLYWRNNVVKALAMLDGLTALGVKKLIFASTAATYGDPLEVPIGENASKEPTNTYGMTKLAMDMAITSECWAYGLAATSLRFFNVAGAYGTAGERHPTETHLIPLALKAAQNGTPMHLFGIDYKTKDGTCVRDYIHVVDLARAMALALDRVTPGQHTIYNLGNGAGFTNREVLLAVEKVTGRQLTVVEKPRRVGDPDILVAASEKAQSELGWQPQFPDLEKMVGDAWEFMRKGVV